MTDDLSVGAEPRRRPRPDRRTVVLVAAPILVAGAAVALLTARPWRSEPPAVLAGTGHTCTVGFGSDLAVVAAQLTNPSTVTPVTIGQVALAPTAADARQTGGPVDVVTGPGCEHVLGLRGDVVAPGGTVWVGITVRAESCRATTVPVVVASEADAVGVEVSVAVPLRANSAPACTVTHR